MKYFFGFCLLLATMNLLGQEAEYGTASYYSDTYVGLNTASGEAYNNKKLTGAHKTLPFGTMVKVTRLDNQKSVVVRINDRGPFIKGRVIDVSYEAAKRLDLVKVGSARVKLEVVSQGGSAPVASASLSKNTTKDRASDVTAKSGNTKITPSTVKKTPVERTTPVVKTAERTPAATTKPKATPTSTTASVRSKSSDKGKYGLYKIQVERPKRTGYGVQIAVYSSYENAMARIAKLQDNWFQDILLEISPSTGGKTMYRVVLGQFPQQSAAESYKRSLKSKYKLDGFVVSLAEM